jgi:hypothetical protein
MGRFIEIGAGSIPRQLTLAVGDLLRLPVSGGRILDGSDCVQIIGPLTSAAIGTNGRVIAPAATPNVMFLLAVASGSATLSLAVGRNLRVPSTMALDLNITARAPP